ncbi:MAG: hypothetical protein Q8R45_15595 [Brevundimonas sp.]|uniref:hypothetical protein n=1 Tax=Brevundimonas sp. TaxID=1871086 RepID=UPI002735FEC3|nr:hypothetical protein [Brevundimonas sp.]MDP3371175.1 hypothetical protein [Brevundimonas sp.]MDP3658378.1 hypothetical protein [Brevundimonas sp.]MDZ4109618.1 hypothetical protein [Brevundimonas sp.]
MKTATIRKALLPVLAASAVMVSTPALAQNFGVTLSFGSPGYSQGYGPARGYGNAQRDLQHRAHMLSQHIERLAWNRSINRNQARSLAAQMNQYRNLEHHYARNGLTARQYHELNARLDRIEDQLQRVQRVRW